MKHLSLLVTVLLAGGLPLTAAALDYGPSRPMLAVETGAPQLPGSRSQSSSFESANRPDSSDDPEAEAEVPAPAAPPRDTRPAATGGEHLRPPGTSSARNKTPPPAKPAHEGTGLSWQALLPGSIQ